jgi:hypothetical protein
MGGSSAVRVPARPDRVDYLRSVPGASPESDRSHSRDSTVGDGCIGGQSFFWRDWLGGAHATLPFVLTSRGANSVG